MILLILREGIGFYFDYSLFKFFIFLLYFFDNIIYS